MIEFFGRGILLDIEGTTSSIQFVYEVMFPFARKELDAYLQSHWGEPALCEACDQIASDAGHVSMESWSSKSFAADQASTDDLRRQVRDEVIRLMDSDSKATGLKQLQGLIWRAGFESGQMKAHVYDDVPQALANWDKAGIDLRIYSSGSVAAQKLFFGHTIVGDLLHLLRGHYDTTTGPKKEIASYKKIASQFDLRPAEILFLSDVVDELNAARAAGLATGLCCRPGNPDAIEGHGHAEITDFTQVQLVPQKSR